MKFLDHIPSLLKNKYLLTGAGFLVVMLFFDAKDIPSAFERRDKLNDLQKSEQHLNAQIANARQELNLLQTNAQTIEKYAREKYLMKKDNEDLFIIKSPQTGK